MTELQELCHYNIIQDINYNKTPAHVYMGTRLQVCLEEIISEYTNTDHITKYSLVQITYFFQTIIDYPWIMADLKDTLIHVMQILVKYVRKNLAADSEICILAEITNNSLLELEHGN